MSLQVDYQLDMNNQWNGTLNRQVDVVPIVPNVQYYNQPTASSSPMHHQTWSTAHLHGYHPTVEVVTVKTPHRSVREVPETSI